VLINSADVVTLVEFVFPTGNVVEIARSSKFRGELERDERIVITSKYGGLEARDLYIVSS